MTTFYLVRHATNDLVATTIAGRDPGLLLNAEGLLQARQLAEHLARQGIQQIFSSPLERTRQTAEPLAQKLGLPVRLSEALNEIDFGEWTGQTFSALNEQAPWRTWNQFRSTVRVPRGEMMLEVQTRMVSQLQRWCEELGPARVAVFSHGDPLRSALAHFLGMPLDFLHRIEISPASVSIVKLEKSTVHVQCLNVTLGNYFG